MWSQGKKYTLRAGRGMILFFTAVVVLSALFLPGGPGNGGRVLAASSQEVAPGRTITVDAIGQVQAVPDIAVVFIGVQTRRSTAQAALQANSRAAQQIIASILKLGIPLRDIQTTDVSVFPITDNNGQPTGYVASTSFMVKTPINMVGRVLDAGTRAGANQIGGVTFGLRDDTKLQAKALSQALKAARAKAEAIASEIGVTIKGVHSVSTAISINPGTVNGGGGGKGGSGGSIAPGQLTISAQVIVTYDF